MGERKHKVERVETKEKANRGKKTSQQVTHPILQLQRLVGNKAVTKLIQRHPEQAEQLGTMDRALFQLMGNVMDNRDRIEQLESGNGPGLESTPAPAVQRQDSMDEEEHISAVDAPNKKDEDGGIWGHMKEKWAKIQSEQKTTPESGSEPAYSPQEGTEDPVDSGEWTEEIQY